jgi:KaiC/GvpD/RAD55 family RecA-like ATPase
MVTKIKDLSILGEQFQERLIKLFFEDRDAFKEDMKYINQNSFTVNRFRLVVSALKNFCEENGYIPSYELFDSLIPTLATTDEDIQIIRETIEEIRDKSTEGLDIIKKESLKFFKQSELYKYFNQQIDNLNRGVDITQNDIQNDIKVIMSMGKHDNIWSTPYDNFEETFSPETVVHIPIGCKEIDEYLQGGIIKGNLVLVCAASGIGKTSISTAISVSATTHKCKANNYQGFKVMQIFFEDTPLAIRKKVMGRLTNIEARFINSEEYCNVAKQKALEYENKELIQSNYKLGRFRSGELGVSDLKNYIQKEIEQGFNPDMIIIDYFEMLLNPVAKHTTDQWKLEALKMQQIENLTKDFGCAIVVTTQGIKNATESVLLDLSKISGAAGKFQTAHMVITLNRTQTEAESNMANLYIAKNREGKSGRVFQIQLHNGIPEIIVSNSFDDLNELRENQKETKIIGSLEENYEKDIHEHGRYN